MHIKFKLIKQERFIILKQNWKKKTSHLFFVLKTFIRYFPKQKKIRKVTKLRNLMCAQFIHDVAADNK